MNETNPLETQLRSWKPRRPSARLERKLFGRARRSARAVGDCGENGARGATRPTFPAFASLLAPAAACLIVATAALNHPAAVPDAARADREALGAMSVSNQSYAAYLPGSFQLTANRLDTFRWTNGGGFHSPMDSLPPASAGPKQSVSL